jgi:hypothetical protein
VSGGKRYEEQQETNMMSNNGTASTEESMEEFLLQTELTDEAYEELAALEGSTVVGISFWDSSLADDLEEEVPGDEERSIIDLDVYLEDQTLLELFAAMLYRSPDDDPLVGLGTLEQALMDLVDAEGQLDEVAQTEDGGLVLAFAVDGATSLIIAVSAWSVDEWDEMPDEGD